MGTVHLTTVTGLKTATTEEQSEDIMAGASDAELKEVGMSTSVCGSLISLKINLRLSNCLILTVTV